MLAHLILFVGVILFISTTTRSDEFNPYNNSKAESISTLLFKDYVQKFKPSRVWREIEDANKQNGINKTFEEEFESIYNRIDETDELLTLSVKNGNPKLLLEKDGRRWRPPGDIVKHNFDPFSIRRRLLELMKQAIYQARNKMIIMQIIREKYRKVSVYKMGFLFSKTDTACKTFSSFAYKAFKRCTMSRQNAIISYALIDKLEANERLLDLWFDVDLLVDLININNDNCKRMLNQVLTNRKHSWKFID